ncbi:aldose epimerase [Leptothermofonsia sichuanensis E412]|uniref:aldose epimerase family protein n=1 Tax=Leptothermofonsia sichuanensis TaxID=2917832 RepID=UPI001CA739A2|nr:aldose epimerase [Leptothermofonsia sichuanensis]QZZ20884.1 aldose epimerase [Leptothermofonsia sichuanensis E412]
MFVLTLKSDPFKTYVLSNSETGASLEVVPERGGMVTRWQVNGQDVLYLDAERFANPALSVRGGIPILFPICGNLPDNTYTWEGQPYTLKQHGFARNLPWEVTDQVTQNQGSLTLRLTSNHQTRAVYPFEFELTFTYMLSDRALGTHQCYTNCSAVPMPFSAGFHPYFQVSDKTKLEFDIPATRFLDQITKTVHPFNGNFDFDQDEIDVAFIGVSRQTATVRDRSQALQLQLDYSNLFSTLVFWTVKGKDYYCLEPWTAPRNALNTGEHLLHLEPGASLETFFNLSVERL